MRISKWGVEAEAGTITGKKGMRFVYLRKERDKAHSKIKYQIH